MKRAPFKGLKMIGIAVGYYKEIKNFDSNREYIGDEIKEYIQSKKTIPVYLHIDGDHFLLEDDSQISLASEIVACYHNEVFCNKPPNDGWDEETQWMEEKAIQHMEDQDQYDDPDYPLPEGY